MSGWVHELAVGDVLDVGGPRENASLCRAPGATLVVGRHRQRFVAAAGNTPSSAGTRAQRLKSAISHGSRDLSGLMTQELQEWAAPAVMYVAQPVFPATTFSRNSKGARRSLVESYLKRPDGKVCLYGHSDRVKDRKRGSFLAGASMREHPR